MKHNIESIEGRVKAVIPQLLHKLIFLHKAFPFLAINLGLMMKKKLERLAVVYVQLLSEDAWDAANILSPNWEDKILTWRQDICDTTRPPRPSPHTRDKS